MKKLWMEGFSSSQIALELGEGMTRNGVIGKVHRLKLSGRAKPAGTAPRGRTTPRSSGPRRISGPTTRHAEPKPPRTKKTAALAIPDDMFVKEDPLPQFQELFIPPEQRRTLLKLDEHTCKWPIGDPLQPDFYFCGQRSEAGRPYCEFHTRRAYQQIERKGRGLKRRTGISTAELKQITA